MSQVGHVTSAEKRSSKRSGSRAGSTTSTLSESRLAKLQEAIDEPEPEGCVSVCYDVKIDLPVQETMDLFTEVVWEGLGFQSLPLMSLLPGAYIEKKGDETGKGCVRAVPGKWWKLLREEILHVEPGKYIQYRVKKGPFPASYHRGCVYFEDIGDGKTHVKWTVKFKAYTGCEYITRFLVFFMFPTGLKSLKQASKKQ